MLASNFDFTGTNPELLLARRNRGGITDNSLASIGCCREKKEKKKQKRKKGKKKE
jgi:hypothetical protein